MKRPTIFGKIILSFFGAIPKSEKFPDLLPTKLSFSKLFTCAKVKKAGTIPPDINRKKSFVVAIIFARKKGRSANSAQKMPRKCPSTRRVSFEDVVPRLHPKAPPQMHHARTLLSLLPLLDRQYFSQAVTRLHNSHPVEGAASVSWICSCMSRVLPPKEKRQMLA